MEYTPELTDNEIQEVHRHHEERIALYKKKGLDFEGFRKTIFEKMGPLEGRILELGTGTGYTALSLAREGYKFVSIDTDKEALKKTACRLACEKLLSKARFYLMDAYHMDFSDASFDNVIAVNLFHHLEKIDAVLAEADRVLRVGGKLIIADFNEKGREIIDSTHREEGGAHDHPMANREQARSLIAGMGYKVESLDHKCHWILVAEKNG
ncbi:MAG: methyltransferase domain-containing protein [Candidatus Omnitrophota bacterium]